MARNMIVSIGAVVSAVIIFVLMGAAEFVWQRRQKERAARAEAERTIAEVNETYRFSYYTHPDVQVTRPSEYGDVQDTIKETVARLRKEQGR